MRPRVAPAVAALVLSAWLGAALFFSIVVAPAAFRGLGVAAAGALVRATLPGVFDAGLIAGLLAVWLGAGGGSGPARVLRIVCGAGIAACCAVSQFVVARRIDYLRTHLATPIETLAPTDPARVAFDQLHALSVGLLAVAMLLAVLAVVLLIRSGLASAVSPE